MNKFLFLCMYVIFHLSMSNIALAGAFTDLYVFGDSLSDSGQLGFRATNPVNSLDPIASTAMVWPQYLSQSLGLGELLPSNPLVGPAGNNYAFVTYRSNQVLTSITTGYLIQNTRAEPHALYVVWGGGNDLRDIRDARAARGGGQATLIKDSQTAADNIVSGVISLSRAGAQVILAPNLPDIGDIPESNFLGYDYISAGNEATQFFKDRLLSRLNTSGANVIQADVQTFFREIFSNPALYGFSNENHTIVAFDGKAFTGIPATEGINGANTASPDPSKYVFFDGIHPTTFTADILAQYYQSILEAPGQISILAEIPLRLSNAHLNTIEDHIRNTQPSGKGGEFYPFAAGGYNHLDVDRTDYAPGYDDRHYSLTAGLSYCFTDYWVVGMAVGQHSAKVDMDDDRGGVDPDGLLLSLLSGGRYKKLTLNAIATIADINYRDVLRNVRLGQTRRSHEGETGGDYYALKISMAFDLLSKNGLRLGPVSSINYQRIGVDDYREDGNLSTSMTYYDQKRRSLLWRFGAFAEYETQTFPGSLQLYSQIAYEKEFKDDLRYVRAGLNTLQGSSFELPGYPPEEDFWIFDLGLNTEFAKTWIAMISYHMLKGKTESMSQGVKIMIQTKF